MEDVYIYDCARTPRGRRRGQLHEVAPHELLATLLRALPERTGLDPADVSDLLAGCVTPIRDQGYNIAEAALAAAHWPEVVAAAQVNRYCASGLETVHQAAARIAAGYDDLIVAGGVEGMSRVPLDSDGGALLTNPELILASGTLPQGVAADLIASKEGFTREQLDTYAVESQRRCAEAVARGHFERSLVPVDDGNGITLLERDGHPRPDTDAEALARLPAAFAKTGALGFDALAISRYPQVAHVDHVHTAGNSSGIVDGAAAVLVGNAAAGERFAAAPRARIRSVAVASSDATVKLLGMIPATERALARAGLGIDDLDLIEVNEAFAAVPLAFIRHFHADHARVNVNGGAIALGHPVGATGSILLGTLVDELERRDAALGLVTLCAGGGQGIAAVVERVA